MKVLLDQGVRDSRGAELGVIDKVIYDPSAGRLIAAVVAGQEGSHVLPAEKLLPAETGDLRASISLAEFSRLPDYDEAHYRQPSTGWQAPEPWIRARTRWPLSSGSYSVAPPAEVEPPGGTAPLPSTRPGASTGVSDVLPDSSRYPRRERVHVEDVLEPPTTVVKTPIERDDASNINPPSLPPEPKRE